MKEIPVTSVSKGITVYRLFNVFKVGLALVFSKLLRRPLVWGAPFVLTIEPTNLCNLACPQCAVGAGLLTRSRGCMSLELFAKILQQTHRSLLYLLLYDQGEPLLHPDYFAMIRLAKSKHVAVTCSTNGQLLNDPETAGRLVASGLDNLILSIDGLTEKSYQTYRRGGQLTDVIRALQNVRQARIKLRKKTPRICVQFLVMKHNEHELPSLFKTVRDWGADRLLIKSMQIRRATDADQWLPRQEKYRRYQVLDNRLLTKNYTTSLCPRLWYSSVIHQDGHVVACCFDKDNQFVLGHIPTTPFAEIWRGSALQDLRAAMIKNQKPLICRNCSYGLALFK